MTSFATPVQAGAGVAVVNTYDPYKRIKTQAIPMNPTTGGTTPATQSYTFTYTGTFPELHTRVTEPNGSFTSYGYAAGRLAYKTVGTGTESATFGFSYDANGNRTQTTDPDGVSAFAAFDAAGNKVAETDSAGTVTTWAYNAANQVLAETVTDAAGAHTSTFTYHSNGTTASMTVPLNATESAVTTFTYDDPAHPVDITSVTEPDGRVSTSEYDDRGFLMSRTVSAGDDAVTEQWTYDDYGNELTHTLPRGTCTVTTGADPCDEAAVESSTYHAGSNLVATRTAPANAPVVTRGWSPRTATTTTGGSPRPPTPTTTPRPRRTGSTGWSAP